MLPKYSTTTLEEDLAILLKNAAQEHHLSIKEILNILSGKGRSLVLIFLSLPFCQPVQIPGLSVLFGILIVFIGFRMAFGKHIWLPEKILLKKISEEKIQKIAGQGLKIIRFIKRFIHPRFDFLCNHPIAQIINGLLICLLGIVLALPLPIPFTNIAVGWSILFLCFGLLENDGLFVIVGYVASLITCAFFIFLFFSAKTFFFKKIYS